MEPQNWTLSGPGTLSIQPSSGPTNEITLTYKYGGNYGQWHTWYFYSTATITETLTFDWDYWPFHSWYQAKARLYVFNNGTSGPMTTPYDGYGYTHVHGSTTIQVTAGQVFGFKIQAYHFDSSKITNGTLRIYSHASTADAGGPYTVAEGSSVVLSGSGSDPDGNPVTLAWDLDNDGQYDDATGANPTFGAASIDGPSVRNIALQVTENAGLFWDFENATSVGGISTSVGTPTGGAISGFASQTGGGPAENFGGTIGKVHLTRFLGPVNYPYIEFTTTEALNLDSISFTHYHNHNPGFPTRYGYQVQLQLDSGSGYANIGSPLPINSANYGQTSTIALGSTALGPGTHRIRWLASGYAYGSDSNTEYFAMNNLSLNLVGPVATTSATTVTVNNVAPTVNAGPDAAINEGGTFSSNPVPGRPGPVLNPANGHYYEAVDVLPTGITWSDAKAAAESLTYRGVPGHLATVTSQQENQFIATTFPPVAWPFYWLGGFQPAGSAEPTGGWQWVTGEPFSYTNWYPGEPSDSNGIEDRLHFWSPAGSGLWNDLYDNHSDLPRGYVVEYDGPFPYSFADPGADTWTATVNYGDGSGVQNLTLTGKTFSLSHVYADNGSYTVTVCVKDDENAQGCNTAVVTVNNVAPTVNAGPDATTNEGGTFSSTPVPGRPGPILNQANGHYYEAVAGNINWFNAKTAAESLTFRGSPGHLVTITSQAENDFLTANFPGAVMNWGYWIGGFQPPGSPEPAGGWQWVTGEPFSYANWNAPDEPNNAGGNEDGIHFWTTAGKWNDLPRGGVLGGYVVEYDTPFPNSFADPGADTWTATVNYGDGTGVQPLALSAGKTFSLSHVYADNGSYTVTVSVTDDDSGVGTDTAVVTVSNVAPTITSVTNNGPINEGSSATVTVTATDPAGAKDPLSYEFDANNDGTYEIGPQTGNTTSITFGDNGSFRVNVRVSDGDGGVATGFTTVVVNNVAPVVNAGPDATINEGGTFSSSGSFTDPGADSPWTATVNYDDGTGTQSLTINQANKTFNLSHLYNDNGTYNVQVCVQDKDNAQGCDMLVVTVNNVAPTSSLTNNGPVVEGSPATINFGPQFDPSPTDVAAGLHFAFDCTGGSLAGATYAGSGTNLSTSCFFNAAGSYTVSGRIIDKDGGSSLYQTTVQVNLPPTPSFSIGGDFPDDACICTPLLMNTETQGAEHLFLKADSSRTVTVAIYARSVNDQDPENLVAQVFDTTNNALVATLSASYPGETTPGAHNGTPSGTEVSDTKSFAAVADRVYRIRITTPNTPSTQPHWRAKVNGATDAAINSPSFASIEPDVPVRWAFNVNGSESLSVRWFSQGVPLPASSGTSIVTLRFIDPAGIPGAIQTLSGAVPPGIDATVSPASSSAGKWHMAVLTNTMTPDPPDGHVHYRLETLGLSDSAIYLTPAAAGNGSITGTVHHSGGGPFPGSVTINLRSGDPSHTLITSTTAVGSFSFPNLFVGRYRVEMVVPAGTNVVGASFFDVFVSCDDETLVPFTLNRPPVAVAPDVTINEGQSVTLDGSGSNDPDGNTLTGSWSFAGDSLGGLTVAVNPAAAPNSSAVIRDDFTGPANLTVHDPYGGSGTKNITVKVNNVAPNITSLSATPAVINEDGIVTLNGTFTDPGVLDTHTVVINWGPGEGSTTLSLPAGVLTFSASHLYKDDGASPGNGTTFDMYAVNVTVTDDGGSDSKTTNVTVNNVAPAITSLSVTTPIDENGVAALTGAFADPGTLDVHTVFIDWDDGTNSTMTLPVGQRNFSATHQYKDDGVSPGNGTPSDTYTITVKVDDDDLGADTKNTPVVINNVAPVVTSLTASAATIPFGGTLNLNAAFTDAGTLDLHTAAIDWGDGSPIQGVTVTESGGSGTLSSSHQYFQFQALGTHTIKVCVTDDDTGQDCKTVYVTVVSTPGKITGGTLRFGNNGRGGFNVQSDDGVTVKGELEYHNGSVNLHAHTMTAIAVSPDRTKGWFAGILEDGREFVAYVEDNGEPGHTDVFKMWVEGTLLNDGGMLTGGNVQIHKK